MKLLGDKVRKSRSGNKRQGRGAGAGNKRSPRRCGRPQTQTAAAAILFALTRGRMSSMCHTSHSGQESQVRGRGDGHRHDRLRLGPMAPHEHPQKAKTGGETDQVENYLGMK